MPSKAEASGAVRRDRSTSCVIAPVENFRRTSRTELLQTWDRSQSADAGAPRGNYRFRVQARPPGSTLKPFTALAGLEAAPSPPAPTSRSPAPGVPVREPGLRCWKHEGHGSLAIHGAIVQSCDVYFYQLGLRIGLERLADFMSKLELWAARGSTFRKETRLFPDQACTTVASARAAGAGALS